VPFSPLTASFHQESRFDPNHFRACQANKKGIAFKKKINASGTKNTEGVKTIKQPLLQ